MHIIPASGVLYSKSPASQLVSTYLSPKHTFQMPNGLTEHSCFYGTTLRLHIPHLKVTDVTAEQQQQRAAFPAADRKYLMVGKCPETAISLGAPAPDPSLLTVSDVCPRGCEFFEFLEV